MDGIEIVQRLIENGYPVTLIAKQSGVPYSVIYNRIRKEKPTTEPMSEKHLRRLERFAFRQPCFDGVEL